MISVARMRIVKEWSPVLGQPSHQFRNSAQQRDLQLRPPSKDALLQAGYAYTQAPGKQHQYCRGARWGQLKCSRSPAHRGLNGCRLLPAMRFCTHLYSDTITTTMLKKKRKYGNGGMEESHEKGPISFLFVGKTFSVLRAWKWLLSLSLTAYDKCNFVLFQMKMSIIRREGAGEYFIRRCSIRVVGAGGHLYLYYSLFSLIIKCFVTPSPNFSTGVIKLIGCLSEKRKCSYIMRLTAVITNAKWMQKQFCFTSPSRLWKHEIDDGCQKYQRYLTAIRLRFSKYNCQ